MTAIMEGKAAMSVEASALAGEYENPDKSRTAGKLAMHLYQLDLQEHIVVFGDGD